MNKSERMRILIFSETEQAKAAQEQLRNEGHHASLRNPQFFDPTQLDRSAHAILADDPAIIAAYKKAGIKADKLTTKKAGGPPPGGQGKKEGE